MPLLSVSHDNTHLDDLPRQEFLFTLQPASDIQGYR